ncbi:MAG: hypothetical protein LUH03_08910 [Oscillospiraceae bacterium]|nr:hypothetical protein [Oscillospiraceae bacterium]
MALTRKMLREMGITDENADAIFKAHWETVEALKGYKAEVERLTGLTGELDNARSSLDDYREKYEALEKEYQAFREELSKEKAVQAKKQAVTEMLRELHIPEECVNPILHVTDFDRIELDESGEIIDEEAVKDSILRLWSGFIPKRYLLGAETATPPRNSSDKGYSRDDIRRMSPREINENYPAIKQSLRVNDYD